MLFIFYFLKRHLDFLSGFLPNPEITMKLDLKTAHLLLSPKCRWLRIRKVPGKNEIMNEKGKYEGHKDQYGEGQKKRLKMNGAKSWVNVYRFERGT